MCFSAQASFTAAAFLSLIGILTIKKARSKKVRYLGSAPLAFAVQQACEGIVWLTFSHPQIPLFVQQLASFGFLFFALIFWPLSIPILLYSLETRKIRKKILFVFVCLGTISAICSTIGIITYGIHPHVINHHMSYGVLIAPHTLSYTSLYVINSLIYVITIVGSLCVSSFNYLWIIGILVAIGLGISISSFWFSFGSVWCFFSAIASILIYFIIEHHQRKKAKYII